jgi:hypothetical protein
MQVSGIDDVRVALLELGGILYGELSKERYSRILYRRMEENTG